MRKWRRGGIGWRVGLACAALYALVLQAVLAAALPHHGPAPEGEALCAHEAALDHQPGQDRAGHDACCALACAASGPPLLPPSLAPIPPAPIRLVGEGWRAPGLLARPPPTHHASPRGPPLA